ncbi:response regulator [Aeromicrobium sp. CTD01-1L150]|uniref:response regulator transcription factor n=1 Tax=Aeromicrobium sp. CTD01-1L150 TaxID=3341830 RepID=UPI0035C0556C
MRVVIAEDSVLLREGLVQLLTLADMDVVAAAGDAEGLVQEVTRHDPDLVIADVRMPPDHTDEGLRAVLQLRRRDPTLAVVVLSAYVEEQYAVELLSGDTAGLGYLLKERVADVEDFIDTIRRVARGGTALDADVVSQLLARRSDPLDRLTPRERDVMALMAEGRSNAGIATELFLSESAVTKYINGIFSKLDLTHDAADNRRVLAVVRFLSTQKDNP